MSEPLENSLLHDLLPFSAQAYAVRGEVADGANGKKQSPYTTVRQSLPEHLFLSHFEGKQCISVCPLIEDGDMCQWGAIDIDSYGDPNLWKQVRKAIELFQIPAFVESSKSMGAHVYILLDKPIKARLFRKALKKLTVWLGYPDAEIRPAQDSINILEGDVGTAMVLPGFGMGQAKAEEILGGCVTTTEHFLSLLDEGDFCDGPPCLFPLQQMNIQAGSWAYRNNYLYQLGVFLRYKFPADFQDRLREFNRGVIHPSLPTDEVENLIRQLEKNGRAHYMCNRTPFDAVCNKVECQSRKYGIAARESAGGLLLPEAITKIATDPPTWFATLVHPSTGDSVRVKFTSNQLLNAAQFKLRVMDALNILPTMPTQKEWEAMIQKLLDGVETVPVPFEHTEEAKLYDDLYTFCTTQWLTQDPEKILSGRIHAVKEGDITTFRFRQVDFINHLARNGRGSVDSNRVLGQMQQLAWLGKIRQEALHIPPLTVQVWAVETNSQLLSLRAEMAAEKETQ